MKCSEFVNFLIDYIEGHLPEEQRQAFEQHLHLCPPCVTYVESYRKCVSVSKICVQPHDDEIPGDVPDELVLAILKARKETQ